MHTLSVHTKWFSFLWRYIEYMVHVTVALMIKQIALKYMVICMQEIINRHTNCSKQMKVCLSCSANECHHPIRGLFIRLAQWARNQIETWIYSWKKIHCTFYALHIFGVGVDYMNEHAVHLTKTNKSSVMVVYSAVFINKFDGGFTTYTSN